MVTDGRRAPMRWTLSAAVMLAAAVVLAAVPVAAAAGDGAAIFADRGALAAAADDGDGGAAGDDGAVPTVYRIPVEGTVGGGLAVYMQRGLDEADGAGAEAALIEIDTLGGSVQAALDIRDAVIDSPVPVIAYVDQKAISAGALITIAADRFYMAPGATIGAAETRPADEKTISFWRAELAETARLRDRDPQVAAAMADQAVVIDGVVEGDQLLTLGAEEAAELGFSDGIAEGRRDVYTAEDLDTRREVVVEERLAEQVARFVTNPAVASILLTLGFIGLLAELFIPGFGLGGLLGLLAFALYFGGNWLAGFGGWEAVGLFVLGIALLIVEVFVPGLAVFGIGGVISVIAGIVLSAPSVQVALTSVAVALVATVVTVVVLLRYVGLPGVVRRLFLQDSLTSDEGYVAPPSYEEYVGRRGTAFSPLRPAGTVEIDGSRYDAVTQGDFIEKDVEVEVVRVSGSQLVVQRIGSDGGDGESGDGGDGDSREGVEGNEDDRVENSGSANDDEGSGGGDGEEGTEDA